MSLSRLKSSLTFFPNKSWLNPLIFCSIVFAAYEAGQIILAGGLIEFAYVGILVACFVGLLAILKDWRRGLYIFLAWILLEDLVRKYLGNNMLIYFAKDILILAVYLAFFGAKRAGDGMRFKPPFRIPFLLFLWWCSFEVFNPASTSIFYGLMGMKMCFLYFPLIVIGYSLIKSDEDLRRVLLFNAILTLLVTALGLAQSIIGPSFLNPVRSDDFIALLSNTYRISSEGQAAYRPTSVFVSNGRFQDFLLVSWPISLGFSAYLFLRHKRGRLVALTTVGTVAIASFMAVSRGVFLYNISSAAVLIVAFLWGGPRKKLEHHKTMKAILTLAFASTISVSILIWYFPTDVNSRVNIYSETLLPSSPTSELHSRSIDYPWSNFMRAFNDHNWVLGYGTGTTSLGVQYVMKFFKVARTRNGVESGYGQLVLEVGFVGLLLWIGLSFSIGWTAWQVVNSLKGTPWFPLAFSIFWFAFLLLIPMAYYSFQAYQDFVMNAYLWFFLGILFRLKSFITAKRNPDQEQHSAIVPT